MRLNLRSQLSGFIQNEGEHWKLLGLIVERQLEAVGEQRLHHQPKLVFRGTHACGRQWQLLPGGADPLLDCGRVLIQRNFEFPRKRGDAQIPRGLFIDERSGASAV